MIDPAIRVLMERLLWPVPRIRWEVARALARLIRQQRVDASQALLEWVAARQLESEVVLGLGVIEAFDLGAHFDFTELSSAIQAPSHLSDLILKENFPHANGLSSFRYAVSPVEPAKLSFEEESWFDNYRKWAVPPIFSDQLEQLQQSTGFPFLRRWNHEWRWLHANHPRPPAEYPLYFSRGDRSRRGQFDHTQRELYVSAYLRTLAYAAIRGSISNADAEHLSLLALPFTRGLGDLEPIQRPDWTYNLKSRASENPAELARCLWNAAADACLVGETPIALKTFEADQKGFYEVDMTMTIEPSSYDSTGMVEIREFDQLLHDQRIGRFQGQVDQTPTIRVPSIVHPISLAQVFQPKFLGRAHIEIGMDIKLASPRVFGTAADIVCDASEIRLETTSGVFSRWTHWYADWDLVTFPELESSVCSLVTVSKSNINELRQLLKTQIRRWTSVRQTARSSRYGEYEVKSEVFSS